MVIKKFYQSESAQKFMQVRIDELCMFTNFGGRDLSSFENTVTLKNDRISLSTMDYSPLSSKNLIDRNWLKKFMQVRIDVLVMRTINALHRTMLKHYTGLSLSLSLSSDWYESDALMLSEECTVLIAGLLMSLNVIDYSISLSGEEFDKSVSNSL